MYIKSCGTSRYLERDCLRLKHAEGVCESIGEEVGKVVEDRILTEAQRKFRSGRRYSDQ